MSVALKRFHCGR